jgi:hypothetical protein
VSGSEFVGGRRVEREWKESGKRVERERKERVRYMAARVWFAGRWKYPLPSSIIDFGVSVESICGVSVSVECECIFCLREWGQARIPGTQGLDGHTALLR